MSDNPTNRPDPKAENSSSGDNAVDCYICSVQLRNMEPQLTSRGVSRGMIVFAIPAYGVVFKCRADGDIVDLEFGAFFALLRFVKEKLHNKGLKRLRVHTSSPEFVFTLSNKGPALSENPERQKLLREYLSTVTVEVAYIRRVNNRALVPSHEFPSTPSGKTPLITPSPEDSEAAQFKPIQKGVSL